MKQSNDTVLLEEDENNLQRVMVSFMAYVNTRWKLEYWTSTQRPIFSQIMNIFTLTV